MTLYQSIIIAIVEGLTEFIPISSTGHMIIASKALNVPDDDFTKMFTVAIQLGAILAVVVLYWKKFFDFQNIQFYLKLIVGVLPALLLGFLFSDKIDELLESTTTVAIALLLGGIVLLFVDKWFNHPVAKEEKDISFVQAFIIGMW
ncbi:MAG: undecaprenyl-diphosphate phosphatase, partial [Chitinophagaceae bacterium]